MRQLVLMFMCVLLASCATPRGYQQLPWARMTVEQAASECTYSVQANPMIGYYQCMDTKGWRAVY